MSPNCKYRFYATSGERCAFCDGLRYVSGEEHHGKIYFHNRVDKWDSGC
jgi:hypothetical protein